MKEDLRVVSKEDMEARFSFPIQTLAFQNLSDNLYWVVLQGVLAEEYGERRADEMINPYLFCLDNVDHVFPSWLSTTNERPDAEKFDFSFDISEGVFRKIAERAHRYHFEAVNSWHPGIRTIVLKCYSREVTQDMDSWKKMHFGVDEDCAYSYDPSKDEIVYDERIRM